jgi:hypothetical protein
MAPRAQQARDLDPANLEAPRRHTTAIARRLVVAPIVSAASSGRTLPWVAIPSKERRGSRLPRYLATWTDGVARVIHAPTLASAQHLAVQLKAPPGVFVLTIKAL